MNHVHVVDIGSVGVDAGMVVVAGLGDGGGSSGSETGSVGGVDVGGVAGEGGAGVLRLVGQHLDLLAHEVVPVVAHAGVEVPVVAGVSGADDALPSDADVAVLAEAAALVEVLVEAAGGFVQDGAGLGGAVVGLASLASVALLDNEVAGLGADEVETESADAGLGGFGVDFVGLALHLDAVAVHQGESGRASAGVVLGVVSLVDGASLADVLDDDESGLALADAVDEYLVGSAGVDAGAPLSDGVVDVALGTDGAASVDAVEAFLAVALEGVQVQHFVLVASVAVVVRTRRDFGRRTAVPAVFSSCGHRQQQHEERRHEFHDQIRLQSQLCQFGNAYKLIRRGTTSVPTLSPTSWPPPPVPTAQTALRQDDALHRIPPTPPAVFGRPTFPRSSPPPPSLQNQVLSNCVQFLPTRLIIFKLFGYYRVARSPHPKRQLHNGHSIGGSASWGIVGWEVGTARCNG